MIVIKNVIKNHFYVVIIENVSDFLSIAMGMEMMQNLPVVLSFTIVLDLPVMVVVAGCMMTGDYPRTSSAKAESNVAKAKS